MFIVYIVAFLIVFFLVSKIFNFNPYDVLGNFRDKRCMFFISFPVDFNNDVIEKYTKCINIHLFDKTR